MSHRHKGPSVYAPGAFIFIVVMCLVYATGAAFRATAREQQLERELSALTMLLDHLVLASRLVFSPGPQRIVPVETIRPTKHHDPKRPVPAFSPEWHYEVGR